MQDLARKVICALDTSSVKEATGIIKKLSGKVGAFKIGHALTLANGLDVIPKLQDAGAIRIFLDLKFHDIPNSVALAVKEAAKRDVWMMTIHTTGGIPMMVAAVEEARASDFSPIILGVSVLTSLDQSFLTESLGIDRTLEQHLIKLSQLALACELDGIVCSPQEVKIARESLDPSAIIVSPGIRPVGGTAHDQSRVGSALQAVEDGADYIVVGRALTEANSPEEGLNSLGINTAINVL